MERIAFTDVRRRSALAEPVARGVRKDSVASQHERRPGSHNETQWRRHTSGGPGRTTMTQWRRYTSGPGRTTRLSGGVTRAAARVAQEDGSRRRAAEPAGSTRLDET